MYDEMFEYVTSFIEEKEKDFTFISGFQFRKRSDHVKRVFMWAERLIDDTTFVNKTAVLIAALFHDIGYGVSSDISNHAEDSALLCEKYLRENGYEDKFINFVVYLVKNHSRKELMKIEDTPLELIILMEADLLDETGALSILWDCMMEGAESVQSFMKTYDHLVNFSYKILKANPMITSKAKAFWSDKQNLIQDFMKHLEFDLGI